MDHEKLFNDHSTKLRQEHNRFEIEIKRQLQDINESLDSRIEARLQSHLELIKIAIDSLSAKVIQHFGK